MLSGMNLKRNILIPDGLLDMKFDPSFLVQGKDPMDLFPRSKIISSQFHFNRTTYYVLIQQLRILI